MSLQYNITVVNLELLANAKAYSMCVLVSHDTNVMYTKGCLRANYFELIQVAFAVARREMFRH